MEATAPPPSPTRTLIPSDMIENEGEYLTMVNDLKKQFDTHKKKKARDMRILQLRINTLVDANTNLEWQNVRLRNMFFRISEKFFNADREWR